MNCQHCGHMLTANTMDAPTCPSCGRLPRTHHGARTERRARALLWSLFGWTALMWLAIGLVAAFATYVATASAAWAIAAGIGAMVVVLSCFDVS